MHNTTHPSHATAVVVSRELRGQGYGGRLMRSAEQHALSLGYHTVHLSTHNMQSFYHHLGYQDGPPTTALRNCVARLNEKQVKTACI